LKYKNKLPEINALIALAKTDANMVNLLLLAGAYEKEQCFLNAYWIYSKMISLDEKTGRNHFQDFYKRNHKHFHIANRVQR
jgi:hypothetical protein